MAEEKDFCTLLSEQIIDERKAAKLYEHLLDLFEDEKELLTHDIPIKDREFVVDWFRAELREIKGDEEAHERRLERARKSLCPPKE